MVELLAKQLRYSGWTIATLHQRISQGICALDNVERVRAQKDDVPHNKRVVDILRTVFDLSGLAKEQTEVLQNLAMLSFVYLDKLDYKWQTQATNLDALNEMIELGWVQTSYNYNKFSVHPNRENVLLHPLVEQLVLSDFPPSKENCPGLFKEVWWSMILLPDYAVDVLNPIEEKQLENLFKFLLPFFSRMELSIASNLGMVLDWFDCVRGYDESRCCDDEISYWGSKLITELYDRLELLLNRPNISAENKFRIAKNLFFAWVREYRGYICFGEGSKKYFSEREKHLKKSFDRALLFADVLPQEMQAEAIEEICRFVIEYREDYYGLIAFPQNWLKQVYELLEQPYPWNEEVQNNAINIKDQDKDSSGNDESDDFDYEAYAATLFPEFYSRPSTCAKKILQSADLTEWEKLQAFHECIDKCFCEKRNEPKFDERLNWQELLLTLSQEIEQLEQLNPDTLDTYAQAELPDMKNKNYVHTTTAYGIVGEIKHFSERMERVLEVVLEEFESCHSGMGWNIWTSSFWGPVNYLGYFIYIVRALRATKHASLALPYLQKLLANIEGALRAEIKYLFYQEISDTACAAGAEDGLDDIVRKEYHQVVVDYKQKMMKITNQTLEFKEPE